MFGAWAACTKEKIEGWGVAIIQELSKTVQIQRKGRKSIILIEGVVSLKKERRGGEM